MKRFWDKVNKTETCWLWTGAQSGQGYKEGKGYGSIMYNGKYQQKELAIIFKLSRAQICRIINNKQWRHLTLNNQSK